MLATPTGTVAMDRGRRGTVDAHRAFRHTFDCECVVRDARIDLLR